jgi:hypothetical protein
MVRAPRISPPHPRAKKADHMKKATPNSLKLHRESLRALTAKDYSAIAGGITNASACVSLCCDPSRY